MEAIAVQLTHREGELLQEKTELKRLATYLKQVCHIFTLDLYTVAGGNDGLSIR